MDEKNRQELALEEQNTEESETEETTASNRKSAFRTLAAFYLAYLVYQLVNQITAGDVPGKILPWMIAAIAAFCAGAAWLIWPEVKRIKEVSCPLNARRFQLHNPCAETGRCNPAECEKPMCHVIASFEHAPNGKRTQVILINESLGY